MGRAHNQQTRVFDGCERELPHDQKFTLDHGDVSKGILTIRYGTRPEGDPPQNEFALTMLLDDILFTLMMTNQKFRASLRPMSNQEVELQEGDDEELVRLKNDYYDDHKR